MITAKEIREHLKEARQTGRNLYLKPLHPLKFSVYKRDSGSLPPAIYRIIGARSHNGVQQARILGYGGACWYAIEAGDAIYIN